MVGNVAMSPSQDHSESIAEALERIHPELAVVRAAGGDPVYLVGGAVRDLLLDQGRADIDLVVEGDAVALAARLGADVTAHERFGTARLTLNGHQIDVAGARTETYSYPGALPLVTPAEHVEEDLRRRDFTINAMAIPLLGEPRLIDPHGGQADLANKQLRVLHPRSFVDDPTRAIRAARYAARFDFKLEPGTEGLLRQAELDTVSADRREVELLRLADETQAPRAFALIAEWGLVQLRAGGLELLARVDQLLASEPWRGLMFRDRALCAAALGSPAGEVALAVARPERPSQAVELASGRDPVELILARALGAEWLDRYVSEWRGVRLEIGGKDLRAAGVPQGPALGRGLKAALRAKLDGEVKRRNDELAVALRAARGGDGVA
jgi:tRNA nucleotidyltransferase (CCA-adding enzyme)